MRKTLILATIIGSLFTSIAFGQAYSNIVGMYTVDRIPDSLYLLGVNLGGGSTLNDLVDISAFRGDVLFLNADRIIVFDSGEQEYTTYAKYDDTGYSGTTVAWRLASDFYGNDANPTLPVGSAVFVQAVGGSSTSISVAGNVPETQTSDINIVAGLQMLAFPFSTSININSGDAGFLSSTATGDILFLDADRIITWNSVSQAYVTYALYDDTGFGGSTREWRLSTDFYTPTAGAITIDIGEGFWYQAQSGFTWTATNPYFDNL